MPLPEHHLDISDLVVRHLWAGKVPSEYGWKSAAQFRLEGKFPFVFKRAYFSLTIVIRLFMKITSSCKVNMEQDMGTILARDLSATMLLTIPAPASLCKWV